MPTAYVSKFDTIEEHNNTTNNNTSYIRYHTSVHHIHGWLVTNVYHCNNNNICSRRFLHHDSYYVHSRYFYLELLNTFSDLFDDAGTFETQYERSFRQRLDHALSGH